MISIVIVTDRYGISLKKGTGIVTKLSLVGSKVIDIRMTRERDLVLLASCVKNFMADRTI